MGWLVVLVFAALLAGLAGLVALAAVARRKTASKTQVVIFCVLAWTAVAVGLNAEVVRFLGQAGPIFIALAVIPNLVLWQQLRRFDGGAFLSALFASSYVLMSLWNGGLEARLSARRDDQRFAAQQAERRARHQSPKYRAGVVVDRRQCQELPAQCWGLGEQYRYDQDYASARALFEICCQAGDERCCGMASAMVEAQTAP